MNVATRFAATLVLSAALVSMSCSNNGTNGGTGGAGGASDGGGGAGGGAAVDAGLQQAQFCTALTTALCARETRCLTLDSAQLSTCQNSIKPLCVTFFEKSFNSARTYDTQKAELCIEKLTNQDCVQGPILGGTLPSGSIPNECQSSQYAPKAVVGAACSQADDCVQGYCSAVGGCAVCTAYQGVGAPCNFASQVCDPAVSRCVNFADGGVSCNAYVARGAPCDGVVSNCGAADYCPFYAPDGGSPSCLAKQADGKSCVADGQGSCTSLRCTFVSDGGQQCGNTPLGAFCAFHEECGAANYCDGTRGFGMTAGICAVRVALGGACTNQFQDFDNSTFTPRDGCISGSCIGGLCKLAAALPAGSECDRPAGGCLPGLYCKDVFSAQPDGGVPLSAGTCTARSNADGGCDFTSACNDGLYCQTGVCTPYRSAGAGPCVTGIECKGLLTCNHADGGVTGLCTPWQPAGTVCPQSVIACSGNASNDRLGFCLYPGGLFDPGTGGAGVCAASIAGGATCGRDDQCISGRCRKTVGSSRVDLQACKLEYSIVSPK